MRVPDGYLPADRFPSSVLLGVSGPQDRDPEDLPGNEARVQALPGADKYETPRGTLPACRFRERYRGGS